MAGGTVDLDSSVGSDSDDTHASASNGSKSRKRDISSVDDDKKVKTPKKLKANEIETEQGLKWWKETVGAGNVQFGRLERGPNFQVPKDCIPKVSKGSVTLPFEGTPQVLWDTKECWKSHLKKSEVDDYIRRSRDVWPIWKRWDQLSSLALLQHCNFDVVYILTFFHQTCHKEAIKKLKDTGTDTFTESKEFDTICAHATKPYRNKWGEDDVRIKPENNDYRVTDAPHAPWPLSTRFELAKDKGFSVQTRNDRKNIEEKKNALKRQATGA